LIRLQALLDRGLEATAELFEPVRVTYGWVHQAAHILANHEGHPVELVRRDYRLLLAQVAKERRNDGLLGEAARQLLAISQHYWRGLFTCYEVPVIPRTNNDLEHFFGQVRHSERRATGRKTASSTVVVRGRVRAVAAVFAKNGFHTPEEIAPEDVNAWRRLRSDLESRQEARRCRSRFRKDPEGFLARLEDSLLRSSLPS
jgi:hypothetical protein